MVAQHVVPLFAGGDQFAIDLFEKADFLRG